ncbi:hemerythrin domain-containing protein [Bacillus sp. JJ1764]|uniref:hemerythrin domain-containing protein n=1 Tax=Bacillus sp. JJ1764 TaxID=3122964 RepID=UPI002FFF1B99
MSGPSLRKQHSHHAIHDGIYVEARDLTKILKQLFKENNQDKIKEVCEALTEHWEQRTLAHAQSEEEGFFVEKLKEQPELQETIIKLKRDHQLLELILEKIKDHLQKEEISEETIRYFEGLLVVFEIHNQEEETHLFE